MNGAFIEFLIDQDDVTNIDEIEVDVQGLLHGQVDDLHLQACGEGLILQGHAHTYYAKQVAQHAVMKATNRRILRNEIEVC
jgi:hypothetical protein